MVKLNVFSGSFRIKAVGIKAIFPHMSAFCNHLSILIYRTNSPMGRTDVHHVLLCQEMPILGFLADQSTHKHQDFSLEAIPSKRNTSYSSVIRQSFDVAYQAISLSYLSELIRAISSSVHNAVNLKATTAFKHRNARRFSFGAKNAVLDPGLRGFADVRETSYENESGFADVREGRRMKTKAFLLS